MTNTDDDVPDGTHTSSTRWWKIAVEASALVTLLVATVYAVGLFALWVPLATSITHDYLTSWYAVSLMPRMVAIGQGVRILFGLPLLLPLILGALPWLVYWISSAVRKTRRKAKEPDSTLHFRQDFDTFSEWFAVDKRSLWQVLIVQILLLPCLVVLSIIYRSESWQLWPTLLVGGMGGTIAGAFTNRAIATEGNKWGRPHVVSRKWLIRTIVTVYVTVVLGALVGSPFNSPSLLYVSMSGQDTLKNSRLVAHADGYWHVIDRQGSFRAIPDDEAGAVQVSSEKIASPSLTIRHRVRFTAEDKTGAE